MVSCLLILPVFSLLPVFVADTNTPSTFQLTSPILAEGQTMRLEQAYNKMGSDGANISPELDWHNTPPATKSFALTLFDPDAPTGHGWWHWLILNIPAHTKSLPLNAGDPTTGIAPPATIQTRNDYGELGYGGPCPPRGDTPHHYIFTLYALKTQNLDINPNTKPEKIKTILEQNTISTATLTGLYSR
jgi:Raf kinase inhibitor-like YbhB/YbcL family protein